MAITEGQVAQVASELKGRRGGVDNDYFGLHFLELGALLARNPQGRTREQSRQEPAVSRSTVQTGACEQILL